MHDKLRRASLASFVMLVIQFGIGMAVNLYVTVPKSDRGQGIGHALSTGPWGITVHVIVGLLLLLSAIGLLVQSIMARRRVLIATAVIGLLSILGATMEGGAFVRNGQAEASLLMAVLTLVALLAYGFNLYLLGETSPPASA